MKFKHPLSPEELATQAVALAQLSDDDIDFSDIPPLDAAFFQHAQRFKATTSTSSTTPIGLKDGIIPMLKTVVRW